MKKIIKIGAISVCVVLVFGLVFFSPTITAKTKYKTQAFDKKLETKQDFAKGKFKNVKIEEGVDGVEIGAEATEGGVYVTPMIEAPFGATHIGLHWKQKYEQKEPFTVYMRTNEDEEWLEVTVMDEEGKNGVKKEEMFAHLVGVGGAQFAQAKIVFENQTPQKLKQFTFTFIDASQEVEDENKKLSFVPRITAADLGFVKTSPHDQSVRVISREEWGADESLRENTQGNEDWPRSYHGTRKLVIHHTADASSNGEGDIDANMATVRAIYQYHAINNKWGDIGYNALVDAAGNIYEGRYGTVGENFNRVNPTAEDIMTLDVDGGHASSYNSGSFGVSVLGDFTDFDIPAAQRVGLVEVLAFVADSRGINVQGNSDYLNYAGNWYNDLNNVFTHRDVGATACPGESLYQQISSIKTEVDNLSGMPTNIRGFDAMIDGADISGQNIEAGTIDFDWDNFDGATEYQYAVEKVFGTIVDPQPWETAWMNDTNTQTVTTSEIAINTDTLEPQSQYVFYVKAIDANGTALSTVKHVNFTTNDLTVIDTVDPIITITPRTKNSDVSITDTVINIVDDVAITADNITVDGTTTATTSNLNCTQNGPTSVNCIISIDGSGDLTIKAIDDAGNSTTQTETKYVITKSEDSEDPIITGITPADGYEAAEKERMTISTEALDNVAVTKLEILFDGISKEICENATNCSTLIQMRKETAGDHVIKVRAFDAANNSVNQVVNITKAGSTPDDPDDPDEPKPVKCHPVKGC